MSRMTSGQIRETVMAEHCAIHFDQLAMDLLPGGWMANKIMDMRDGTDRDSYFWSGLCGGSQIAFIEAAMIIRDHCGQGGR